MITKYFMSHICAASILLFGLVSLLLQMIMVLSLNSYVKDSANMKTTKKKIFLNLKNQFETIYGMDCQVRNVSAYVEKYLLKLKFMGVPYSTWEKVPFLASGIASVLAGGEAFYLYLEHRKPESFVEVLFAYGITVACFYIFFHIFGVKNKKAQIQIQLVDYLENHLANRLIRTKNEVRNSEVVNLTTDNLSGNNVTREQGEDEAMLRQLIMQMAQKKQSENPSDMELETAGSLEEDKTTSADAEDPNLMLLEEFVQSFLA